MPFPPPIIPDEYTPDQRALIAGYLLHFRAGTLQALESTGQAPAGVTMGMEEAIHLYHSHAESYSRFLLYWLGYPVGRRQMYHPGP